MGMTGATGAQPLEERMTTPLDVYAATVNAIDAVRTARKSLEGLVLSHPEPSEIEPLVIELAWILQGNFPSSDEHSDVLDALEILAE